MLKHTHLTFERIRQFVDRFQALFYSECIPLQVEVAGPVDRITYEEAQKLQYQPARIGMPLAPQWSTYWFRLRGTVPEAWRGKPVDLLFITHGECLLWRDGKPVQGLTYVPGDSWSGADRKDARLYDLPQDGNLYLEVEAASNRGGIGPYTTLCAQVFERADIGLFDPEAWDFYWDLYVPTDLLRHADANRLSPWEGFVLATMNEVANVVRPEDRSTWQAGRDLLKRLYDCRNATYTHELTAIGHGHLDTAWLWPLAETMRKAARTFSSALAYMRDYPDYKFAGPQACQYQWMKDRYPSLYQGIQEATRKGQWIPVGGSWVEPDCNVPSGESLVRQFLYGKRFFRQELGWECREFWNPDVFGYSGALPQILRGVGIEYFLTQKLSWNQFNKPEHHTFLWEGIDGSRVLTHFPPADTYNGMADRPGLTDLLRSASDFKDPEHSNQSMLLFGHGDGGGGPRKGMLEILKRVKDFQGVPRTEQRGSLAFFESLARNARDLPVVVGELYLEYHRGTYTTQAANKRDNRRCEFLLRDVEMLSVLAERLGTWEYPAQELERLWKLVLLNQFHDILPGSSITEVYRDSARDYAEVIEQAGALRSGAVAALTQAAGDPSQPAEGLSVLNTCGWERAGVFEAEGCDLEAPQRSYRGNPLLWAKAPSVGVAAVPDLDASCFEAAVGQDGGRYVLENGLIRAEFLPTGQLVRLLNKQSGRESVDPSAPANQFVLFDDHPVAFEAWDVDVYHLETRCTVPPAAGVRIIEEGPARVGLEFAFEFAPSSLVERVFLACGDGYLQFECEVDWQHRQQFLKVEFPVLVRAMEAAYEIQFGHVKRPTHFNTRLDMARFEVPGHKWADLSEPGHGVALFTDSKYGYAVHGSVMRLSLLRGPNSPDPEADRGRHAFRFACYPHEGDLAQAEVVRRAFEFNNPWQVVGGTLAEKSWLSVDSPHLVIDTVKKAEDSDAFIVRLYEAHGTRGRATLRTALPVRQAERVNLLEEDAQPLSLTDGQVKLDFRPFELITLLLH